MSEVMLTIIDADRAIHDTQHGSVADALVAALTAEPETIAELEAAVARYLHPIDERPLFAPFYQGISEEAWDAGLVIIDLPARMIVAESTYSRPGRTGAVHYHDGEKATDILLHYELSDDWLAVSSVAEWRGQRHIRRQQRAAQPPLDARRILFGRPLTEFLVREFRQAQANGEADPADIHARWLTTPRDDLRNQAPRELLLAKRKFIDNDLHWRAQQWAFVGECPAGLELDTAAYRWAGFGTHEIVIHYDLVRHLLAACEQAAQTTPALSLEAEIERLEHLKNDWLYTPQFDVGRSPSYIIEQERQRIPVTMGAGCAVYDEDCPMCQDLGGMDFGPMFWHLDGSSMDEGFVFSFHPTLAEYEAEQREWAEMTARFERERQERLARGEPEFPGYYRGDTYVFAEEPWDEEPDKPEYLC